MYSKLKDRQLKEALLPMFTCRAFVYQCVWSYVVRSVCVRFLLRLQTVSRSVFICTVQILYIMQKRTNEGGPEGHLADRRSIERRGGGWSVAGASHTSLTVFFCL